MTGYSASEVFQFAIKIEENGEKFYRTIATSLESGRVKDLFIFLANEESAHCKVFDRLLSQFADYEPAELYPEEYFLYLRAFANNMIFNRDIEELAKEINNSIEKALQFAMMQESEAILFYQELKKLVPENEKSHVDDLIEEEQSHYLKLSQYADELKVGV